MLSNIFFLLVGLLGTQLVLGGQESARASLFIEPAERWPYFIFFLGVALTAFGSGYYHANPGGNNAACGRNLRDANCTAGAVAQVGAPADDSPVGSAAAADDSPAYPVLTVCSVAAPAES